MCKYNYFEEVKNAVLDFIEENIDEIAPNETIYALDKYELEDLEESLEDTLWNCDDVTGNASGSYTFNAYEAEECLCHNFDLLRDAVEAFDSDIDLIKSGAEACDVLIRCYLLNEAVSEAVKEYIERGC